MIEVHKFDSFEHCLKEFLTTEIHLYSYLRNYEENAFESLVIFNLHKYDVVNFSTR